MMSLVYIDITDSRQLLFVTELGDKREIKKITRHLGQRLNFLLRLERFLAEKKLTLKKISGLVLLEGQGSFSEVRLTAAVLNAIHLNTGLPVLGLDKRTLGDDWQTISATAKRGLAAMPCPITPIYSGEPNISIPKV